MVHCRDARHRGRRERDGLGHGGARVRKACHESSASDERRKAVIAAVAPVRPTQETTRNMAVEYGCSHTGATHFMRVWRARSSCYIGASLRVPYESESLQEAADHRRCGPARFMARQTPSFITKSACRSCLAAALAHMGRTSCGRLGERANFGFGRSLRVEARPASPPICDVHARIRNVGSTCAP